MRNLLLALTTGFLAAEALSFYHDYTLNRLRRAPRLDETLEDVSLQAHDAAEWARR